MKENLKSRTKIPGNCNNTWGSVEKYTNAKTLVMFSRGYSY